MPDWQLVWKIAEPVVMIFIGGFINQYIERRPKLIRYVVHPSSVTVRPPGGDPTAINVHAMVVRNTGRKPAMNVRIGHNVLPDFTIFPNIQYTVEDLPAGGREIIIPLLVAGQDVTIQYLYFPPLVWHQINTHVFSDEGAATSINVWPTRQFSRPVNIALGLLLVIGGLTVIYLIGLLGRYLFH